MAVSAGSLDGLVNETGPAEDISGVVLQSATATGTSPNGSVATASGTDTGAPAGALGIVWNEGETFKVIAVNDTSSLVTINLYVNGTPIATTEAFVVGYSSNALLLSQFTPDTTALEVTSSASQVSGILSVLSTSPVAEGTSLSFSGTGAFTSTAVACFMSGTHITTNAGEQSVENLDVGDLLATNTGRLAPVKWLGHRRIDCRRHPAPAEIWPVRVAVGAFGQAMPARPLWLSPDHAVYAEGVLIPVKYLINGSTITQEARDEVTYWHVELDRHDMILAEGLPCESYLDTSNRHAFTNGGRVTQLHPEFAGLAGEAMWEAAAGAPLRIEGPAVDRVIDRLRRRAAELGFSNTNRPQRPATASGTTTSDLAALLQPAWYLAANPDVAASGIAPAAHYASSGRAEGRLPCSEAALLRGLGLIDPGLLVFTMSDVIAAGVDPVEHFCMTGWREGRRPNPYFDTTWYIKNHQVPPDINPLVHYVTTGEALGHCPSQHFDPAWYRRRYALADSLSPLAHYLAHRRTQCFSPLPSFDIVAYRQAHAATIRPERDLYAHFLAIGQLAKSVQEKAELLAA